MIKIVGKCFIGLVISLCVIEVCLDAVALFYHAQPPRIEKRDSHAKGQLNLMFIGDSWTQGADAAKGQGYVDVFVDKLRKLLPARHITAFNYGQGSFNSAEGVITFMENKKNCRPDILFVLMGMNNCWNIEDLDLARMRLEKELGSEKIQAGTFLSRASSYLGKIRLYRFGRIVYYNWYVRYHGAIGPHPMNGYVGPYFQLHGQKKLAEAREYLITHFDAQSSYDDMYRIMLYSFEYNKEAVEQYLKAHQFWRPALIKYSFDQRQRNMCLDRKYELLEEHIRMLKTVCERQGITMILQDYPSLLDTTIELDVILRSIAEKYAIPFVDHYSLFRERLTEAQWRRIMTVSHVAAAGYQMMADNLICFVFNGGIIDNQRNRGHAEF